MYWVDDIDEDAERRESHNDLPMKTRLSLLSHPFWQQLLPRNSVYYEPGLCNGGVL